MKEPGDIKGFGDSQFQRLLEAVNDEISLQAGFVLDGARRLVCDDGGEMDARVATMLNELFVLRAHIKAELS